MKFYLSALSAAVSARSSVEADLVDNRMRGMVEAASKGPRIEGAGQKAGEEMIQAHRFGRAAIAAVIRVSAGRVRETQASTLQPHAFLHARPRADALAPGGYVFEPGAVDQRFAPGIDRVKTEISDGDLIAGEIRRASELLVSGAELRDEAVLVAAWPNPLRRGWRATDTGLHAIVSAAICCDRADS